MLFNNDFNELFFFKTEKEIKEIKIKNYEL